MSYFAYTFQAVQHASFQRYRHLLLHPQMMSLKMAKFCNGSFFLKVFCYFLERGLIKNLAVADLSVFVVCWCNFSVKVQSVIVYGVV